MFRDEFIVREFWEAVTMHACMRYFVCLVEVMMRKFEVCTGGLLGRTWRMLVLELIAHVQEL